MHYQVGKPIRRSKLRVRYIAMVGLLIGGASFAFKTDIGQTAAQSLTSVKTRVATMNKNKDSAVEKPPTAKKTPPKNDTKTVPAVLSASTIADTSVPKASGCGTLPRLHAGLASSGDSELLKLAEYETICNGALADRVSFFIPMPTTNAEALSLSKKVAGKLKAFAVSGVAPLIFFEPNNVNGDNVDLAAYSNGAYDAVLDTYFSTIKSNGVSDDALGMWVYFPEANMPGWGSVSPSYFAANVTKTVQLQKKYFPTSLSSIMLNAKSYTSASSWNSGSYVSLAPYVQSIPRGLIDSVGMQGFPWAAPANTDWSSLYNPAEYMPVRFAAEVATILGTKNIWLNTGTFSTSYAGDLAQNVQTNAAERQKMLNGAVAQASLIKVQGFNVAIHLFAENKVATSEAIDWSYWHDTTQLDSNADVLKQFSADAHSAGVAVWLFDSEK